MQICSSKCFFCRSKRSPSPRKQQRVCTISAAPPGFQAVTTVDALQSAFERCRDANTSLMGQEPGDHPMSAQCELTILMPCLNEAETLGTCITKAKAFIDRTGIPGEVLIADNGSTDGSPEIAADLGARLVPVPERGYGAALLGGIAAARGRYISMADADDSYDFARLDAFVDKLRNGCELVMGNRFLGGIMPGAMPPLHRYLGNPVLTGIGRLFFGSPCNDFHCGLRGF